MKLQRILTIIGVSVVLLLAISVIRVPGLPNVWSYLQALSIKKTINTFTDPVLLPAGHYRNGSTFTSYVGWNNAYEIRVNTSLPGTNGKFSENAYIIQFTSQSILRSLHGQGPTSEVTSDVKAMANNLNSCNIFDQANSIWYCKSSRYGYLIRRLLVGVKTYYLADIVFNGNAYKEPRTADNFMPQTDGFQHLVLSSVQPLSLKNAQPYYVNLD